MDPGEGHKCKFQTEYFDFEEDDFGELLATKANQKLREELEKKGYEIPDLPDITLVNILRVYRRLRENYTTLDISKAANSS